MNQALIGILPLDIVAWISYIAVGPYHTFTLLPPEIPPVTPLFAAAFQALCSSHFACTYHAHSSYHGEDAMKTAIMLWGVLCFVAATLAQPVVDQVIPITTPSEEARTLFLQGRDQLENIDFAAAATLFDRAIEQDDTFALAYLYRSLAGGSTQTIQTNMEKAEALAVNASEGERLLIAFYKALNDANGVLIRQNLDKLLMLFPDDKRIKTYAGFYYQGIAENKKAIELYSQALQIDKEYAPAYNYSGYANMALEEYGAAEKAFKEYIRLMPHLPNPYDSYAEFLLKRGRFDESIVQYQKAYDTDNQFTTSLAGIGNNYLFKGEYDKARSWYQKYFTETPRISDKLSALRLKARSYLYQGRANDALTEYAQHRALAEKEKQYTTMLATCFGVSFIMGEMGSPVDCLNKCKQAAGMIDQTELSEREKENLNVGANYWFAYAYAVNHMFAKARNSLESYNSDVLRRNNPDELLSLHAIQGFIDFQGGQMDAALAHFAKLENNPWAVFYQGKCLLEKGNKKGARHHFEKVVDWNQENLLLAVVWRRAHEALGK
jgi:tetratricopeptide (TPR) repeat protein